jgi:class 3 adenylate cyclase
MDLAAKLGPAKLVAELTHLFSSFGELVAERQLETIKTIGDGYMVAGNCNHPLPNHVHAMADLALAMRETIKDYTDAENHPLGLRIGIHVGPVVAGVMHLEKLSYDLWGDTVNIASRMESQGGEGVIQVTQDVIDVIGTDYRFDGPFVIDVRGKGTMRVYRLLGRRTEQASTSAQIDVPAGDVRHALATEPGVDVSGAPRPILTIDEGAPQPTSTRRRWRLGVPRKFPKLPMMWQRPRRR